MPKFILVYKNQQINSIDNEYKHNFHMLHFLNDTFSKSIMRSKSNDVSVKTTSITFGKHNVRDKHLQIHQSCIKITICNNNILFNPLTGSEYRK